MNHTVRFLAILFGAGILSFSLSGCKRAPDPHRNHNADGPKDASDIFKSTNETFRYSAGSGDDWTRFRDGLTPLQSNFNKADMSARLRLSAEDRSFLANEAHLSEAEFAEIDGPSFRGPDAHYLDECYLLRDADQLLQIANTTGVEQIHHHFRWVMRNVLLHEQGDDWMPPAFTLRRGWGNAVERSLAFLALLRQASLEGCLIVVPDTDPPQFLVAVIEPKTARLRLFDPRVGLAVPGKDGKGIATLRDALAEPKLLAPVGIGPEQAKKLEAWLVCPLFAMSPRMLVLQEGLSRQDSIVLHLDAPAAGGGNRQRGQAAGQGVERADAGKKAGQLADALPVDVPAQDRRRTGRRLSRRIVRSQMRLPLANVVANLAPINVTETLLPRIAWSDLLARCADLCNKYDLQPREMYLHGLHEAMFRRQSRVQPFVSNEGLKSLLGNAKFRQMEVPKWIDQVRTAFAPIDADDPKQKAQVQQARGAIWGQDAFLAKLIDVDKDEQVDREGKNAAKEITVVTKIMAVGTRDYLEFAVARLQACAETEKAERAQAIMQTQKAPGEGAKKRADDGWREAKGAWANAYLQYITPKNKIGQYAVHAQHLGQNPADVMRAVSLLETVHLDLQRYFNAKLRLAECKAHTDRAGAKAAAAYLEEVQNELDVFTRTLSLQEEIDRLSGLLRVFPPPARAKFQHRLDLLARDWSERGNFYWLKRQIDERLAGMQHNSCRAARRAPCER